MRKSYPKLYGFNFATGDVNYLYYGATWSRKISDTAFHFIKLINWEDTCGTREAKEIGTTYNLQLSEVDLKEIAEDRVQSAWESCGQWPMPLEAVSNSVWQAETLLNYGLHAPLRDVNTSNFHKTFRELAAYSRELSANWHVHDLAMRKQVNRLGSTAKEFMRGDLDSALARGLIRGDASARIMAKMQGRLAQDTKEN